MAAGFLCAWVFGSPTLPAAVDPECLGSARGRQVSLHNIAVTLLKTDSK